MSLHVALFVTTLALLLVHELDAMRCHEWRIFPVLEKMGDRPAMLWFVWLHVPLIWLILWFGAGAITAGGNGFSLTMCIFAVLHALVHWLYERHPACEFRNPLSRSIIWSCAAAGALGIAARFAGV